MAPVFPCEQHCVASYIKVVCEYMWSPTVGLYAAESLGWA